jgi:hypothetical protein
MDCLRDARKPRYQLATGQYIAHAQKTKHERAFLAADLHLGRAILAQPTVLQCAHVHAALRKDVEERERILAGLEPLVSPLMRTVLAPRVVTDDQLIDLAHLVGPDRWLSAATEAGI